MSGSIEQAVMQIKHDVSKAFDAAAIVALCQSIGYSWRTRQFDPVATIQGFLLQVLHGNTACSHAPRLLGKAVTAEAYGMARSRLPLELFQRLLEQVCNRLRGCVDTAAGWRGHRVWIMARYAGVAAGLRSAIRAGSWLWLSHRTFDDTFSHGHWDAPADSDCANADARPRASLSHARGIGTRRYRACRSRIQLFFPYGNALAGRHVRRVSGSPAADRQLSERPHACAAKPAVSADEARPRLTKITLGSMDWPLRSDR